MFSGKGIWRAVRLYAAGKITEAIWDNLWREWQDKRNQIQNTLETLQERRQTHIANLDSALEIISHVGIVLNNLSRDDRRELLWQMIERVIVDSRGNVSLKLRTLFAYLQNISDEVRNYREEIKDAPKNTKTDIAAGSSELDCSTQVLLCTPYKTTTEHLVSENSAYFFRLLEFPQHARIVRLSNKHQ